MQELPQDGAAELSARTLASRAFLGAQRTAAESQIEAYRHAASIVAEGESRASVIEAQADAVRIELVAQFRQAIVEASKIEQARITAVVAGSYDQLIAVLDDIAERLEQGSWPLQPRTATPPSAARPQAAEPAGSEPEASMVAEFHGEPADRQALEEPPDDLADDAFWAELRRALDEEGPLGPVSGDDAEACDTSPAASARPARPRRSGA